MFRQKEEVLKDFAVDQPANLDPTSSVSLLSQDEHASAQFRFTFEAMNAHVFRTTFSSEDHPLPPTSSIDYKRLSEKNSSKKKDWSKTSPELDDDRTKTIVTSDLSAVVTWKNGPEVSITWRPESSKSDALEPLYRDLPFRSYVVDGTGVSHYTAHKPNTLYAGLGEKCAPMDLSGRNFLIATSDTFGYNAFRTDPLYKHIPLLINATPAGCVAVFSTSLSRASWSVGGEIDGLWGKYNAYRQSYGGLELYIIVQRTLEDLTRTYAELVGFPLRVPRYMFGYIAGGMKYSMLDEPRASDAIVDFLDQCKTKDIPCSAFQMSSGYTVAEVEPKTRNVFTWNHHRFPDPAAFTAECHKRGIRLLANVKPYVLKSHPKYDELSAAGAFFRDPVTGAPAVARLWSAGGGESGEGSHIDFTSEAGYSWWVQGVKDLKNVGIDVMWNDNNEYNILRDDWECAISSDVITAPEGITRRDLGFWGRALHTELMGKASRDATQEMAPNERALVLTRSATAGTMRYCASSWSGDNVTSWDSMRGGNSLALNAGLSLLQIYGHDTGGFEGPQPSPELLIRWIQLAVHSPRFAINCFKTSTEDNLVGEVIEPWMYPEVTPIIRQAIKRRYELIPYTYSLALRSHVDAIPPMRWTGWGYESDANVWSAEIRAGETQYWLGDALLICGVYTEGADTTRVYLPSRPLASGADLGYMNTNEPYQLLEAGCWHDISTPLTGSIAVLARLGTAVPVGKPEPTVCTPEDNQNIGLDDWRGLEIYPPPANKLVGEAMEFRNTWLEDDGVTVSSDVYHVVTSYAVTADEIVFTVRGEACGAWTPHWVRTGSLDVILPVGEERPVKASGGAPVEELGPDEKGRRRWRVPIDL